MRIEPIITARLKLRGQEKADADFVLSIWNDREMGKYLSDPYQEAISEAYHRLIENLGDGEDGCYLIAESRETGERIGTISFFPTEDGKTYDIGYCIHKSFWRKGYGTEMVQGVVDYAKAHGVERITSPVAKANDGSNGVMRKCGFHVAGEGSFQKSGTDIVYPEYQYELLLNQK